MKKRNAKKGFTIVELVIVIAVIAILAAVLIPTFSGVVDKANQSAAYQEGKNLWTEYLAQVDYTQGEPEDDLVIVVKNGAYYVTVSDGKLSTEATKATTAEIDALKAQTTGENPTAKEALYSTVFEAANKGTNNK